MRYALSTVRHQGRATPVLEIEDALYSLEALAPHLCANEYGRGLMALFAGWDAAERELSDLAASTRGSEFGRIGTPAADDILTPLQFPRKLILGGANYYEHMRKDAGKPDFRKDDGTPVFFLKPPTTTLVGAGRSVRYPSQSAMLDWEIELALVVGKPLYRASEAEASDAVAAYTVGLDLSARDWQMNPRHPWKFDLFTGKAFDTSCPLGPRLVPARFVDPGNLRLRLSVNGVVKQDAHTSDMIWSVAEQLSILSQHVTLEPGDIVLTGTPAGVGLATGTYLQPADIITAEIEGLGILEVEVMPDESEAAARVSA